MRVLVLALALLVLWHAGSAQELEKRHGRVRGDGHVFVDDTGPFLARGATLFWGLWGYQHDRERLARNLATLRGWGVDYIRVLGVVGAPGDRPGDSWHDRRLDPSSASYDQDAAAFTDWAYQEYGLRVQWTIFGGVDFTPTPELRRALIERFGNMSRGREDKIFAFEIANEAWQNGFPGEQGRSELHALARLLKEKSSVLVALSAPEGSSCKSARELYRDSVADLMTLHLARGGTEAGAIWETFREPWSFRDCAGVPLLASSNEPIGPQSSVASMDDPVTLSSLALVTYGSGIGAFVLHTGAGIRGGGAADEALARPANLWEVSTGARIAEGLDNLTKVLPGDLANWSGHDGLGEGPDRLFDIVDRSALAGMYCFTKSPAYACVPFGIRGPVQLVARRKLSASVSDLVDGGATPPRQLAPREALHLSSGAASVLILGRSE